jgi:choline dehydrogenase-like flavoprotein
MAARTLARAGLRTVVLEEGDHHSTCSFRDRPVLERFSGLYRDGGATFTLGRVPLLLPTGRAVGGTTVVNAGTCYRTPRHVVRSWTADSGFEAAERLEECLDEVELSIQVGRQPLGLVGRNGELALLGARRLGWRSEPLLRNAPGCRGAGECVTGCPSGAKQSVQLSLLPEAWAAGARVVTRARAERILVERDGPGGPRAVGVRAADGAGHVVEIMADLVVVAAGALQSPALLRRSGLGGHPSTGRNLSVHPTVSVAGCFAEPVVGRPGALQSVSMEEFHADGVLIEATTAPPGMTGFVLPGVGRELREELERAGRLATFGAMVADLPSGRVLGRDRVLVRYDLSRRDAGRVRQAMERVAAMLFAADAGEVLTGIAGTPRVHSPAQIADVMANVPVSRLHLSAFHPSGTLAAGGDPGRHPADRRGMLRGVRGVLIADGSLLPSCPEVNPQLSIMAASLAVCQEYLT